METTLLVILALAAATTAGPITVQESDKCSETCSPSNKFKYNPGMTYTYDYSVDTETSMSGASQDTAKLTILTSADVQVISPCEFSLTLKGTQLMHSDASGNLKTADKSAQFSKAVEASELRFSFQDGVVDTVCSGSSDEAWVMNFKKGILSSLQNSMDDVSIAQNITESDISGSCKTEYKVVSDGYYSTSVSKTKDMISCSGRQHFRSMLQMTPYNTVSDVQSAPIMRSSQTCAQEMQKGGVLKSTVCTETHVYRPFANGNNGAVTSVKQSLTYKTSKYESKMPATITSKDSLAFDHSVAEDTKEGRKQVENHLRVICDASRYDVRPESPRQFSELVSAMRMLSGQDMEDLHKMLKTKTMCPDNEKTFKFFLDALPLINTPASIKMMTSLISSSDVEGVLAKAWIASLAFVQIPSSDMLISAKSLIDNKNTREESLLPVSAMINNFCSHSTSCEQDQAVQGIMTSLESNLGYRCDASGKQFEKILFTLRAIGNAGKASRGAGPITSCLKSEKNPLEIRVAAIQAFRRMPCDAKNDDLWTIYNNGALDSELRVAAYLALMRCPSEDTLNKMAASLTNEEDDQVGAFVYSHLTNLRKSSDPHRQEVARAAERLTLNKEFELNALKFSRNFEASALIKALNTGFAAESNLVWSTASQMPRSLSGNLTLDLFGQAINLVDFGGRMEGVEHLVKNVFGSYFADDKTAEEKKPMTDNVEGSMFARLFGNELMFIHSSSLENPITKLPSNSLDMLIQLAKKQEYTFTQSAQFMDVSLVVPTSAGLPLVMDVSGTATLDLALSGKMDLRKLGSSPRSLDVDGEIRPSAAVELTGTMSVDAMVTRTGLRMRNTVHTSTAMKGRVELKRGQVLNMELDTPQDKMEVFSAGSKFFIMHNDMEQEQAMITENRQSLSMCSGDQMAHIVGIELCGELSYPNASMTLAAPSFPFTGPASASITLLKRDSHVGYKIFAKRVQNKKASSVQVTLNTPGSKVDRSILLEAELNYPKQTLDATMRTPWKKASIKGATINDNKMKSLSGRLLVDDKDEYAFTTEVKIDRTKARVQFSPMVEVRRVGADNVQLTGFVSVITPFKAADVELSLSGLSKMPMTLKTSLKNNQKEKSISSSLSIDGKTNYTLQAAHSLAVMGKKAVLASLKNVLKIATPTRQLVSVEATGDYKEGKSLKMEGSLDIHRLLKKPATLKVALLKNAKKRGVRFDADVSLKSSTVSGKLDSFTFIKSSGLVSAKHVLSYTIPKVAKNKITLGGKFNDRSTKAYNKYSLKSNLEFAKSPEYNMGLNVNMDHKKKHSSAEVELKYGKNPKDQNKRIFWATSLSKKALTKNNAFVNFQMEAKAPEHNVDINILGKHQHTPKSLDSSLALNYGKGKDLKAEVALDDKSSKLKKYNGKATVSGFGQEYTLASGVDQKSAKQYSHVLNFKTPSDKHSLITMYKSARANTHSFNTKLSLSGMKSITVSGATNLDPRNFDLSGEVSTGKEAYGFKTNSKVSKGPSAKVEAELYYPTRRMTLLVDGGRQKGKYNGRVETAWDADNNKTQMIIVDGAAYMKQAKSAMSLGGDLSFSSPFEGFEDLMTTFKYGSDDDQHDFSTKMSAGGKGNTIMSSFSLKKPFSLTNLKVNAETKTPFKGFRVISFDIDHSLTPTLKSILAARWEKETAKIAIEGESIGDIYNRNLKGSLALTSTMKGAKDLKLDVAHMDGNGKFVSKALFSNNGKPYGYDINMAHSQIGWNIKNSGDLVLVNPETKIKSSWKHKNSDNVIKSSVSSDWGKQHFQVDVDATQDLINSGVMSGNMKMTTPWKTMRHIDMNLSHKHGEGKLVNKATMKMNGKMSSSSYLKYNSRPSEFNVEFDLTSPFYEDFNGKVVTQYSSFPVTGLAQISWSPKSKAVVEGSITMLPTNFDLEMAISSPFHEDIKAKVSSKHSTYPMTGSAQVSWSPRSRASVEGSINLLPTNFDVELAVASPFHKNIKTKVSSAFGSFPMTGMAEISWAPKAKATMEGSVTVLPTNFDVEFALSSPFHKDITSKVSTKYGAFPMTGLAQVSWSPKSKATVEGSLTVLSTNFDMELSVASPFHKDIKSKVSSKFGAYPVTGVAEFSWAPKAKATVGGSITLLPTIVDAEIAIASPFHEDINAKVNSNFGSYPMTGMAEMSWAPKSKATVESSLNMLLFHDADAEIKMTTPFNGYKNVVLRASNKLQNGESVINMNFDYGMRKNFDIETRIANTDARKLARFTMRTPFEQLKSLTTGFQATGKATDFDSSADFEMFPIVGKFEGNLNMKYEDDVKGLLRIDTPFKQFPYFELSTQSQDKNNVRHSFIKANYYPRNMFSLDSTYRFQLPMTFEATVNTPFPEFDNINVAFNHDHSSSKIISHGEVTYQPSQKIEGDLSMDWESNMDGSLVVKTPFAGFESTKIVMRHQGDMNAFSSHGEANVADQTVSADASFKSGYATSGVFTFNSPIPSLENIELSINKKGNMKNVRGGASFSLNGVKSQANFNHKMGNDALKSAFSLDTPYTEILKMSVDHNGALDSFTNKMSFNYGRNYDVDTVLALQNQQSDISGNGMIKSKLNGPRNVARVSFSKNGMLENLSFSGTASYNRADVSVNGSWKLVDGIEGSVQIATPFKDFKNLDLSLSHTGDFFNFKSESVMTYMDKQTINGKAQLTSNGINTIRFISSLTTPFEAMKSTELKMEHDLDQWTNALNGAATLTSTVGQFGQGSVSYSKSGNLDNFVAKLNGKYAGDVTEVSITKSGSMGEQNVITSASLNNDVVKVEASLKTLSGLEGSIRMKTPFEDYRSVGLRVAHNGVMTDFHSEASVDYTDNKNVNGQITFAAADFNSVKLATEMNTPRELIGSSKLTVDHEINQYRNTITTKAGLSGAVGDNSFQFSKSGSLNDLTVQATATHNGEEMVSGKFTTEILAQSFNTDLKIHTIATPTLEISFAHQGDSKNFNTKAMTKLGSYNQLSTETSMNNGREFDLMHKSNIHSSSYGNNQASLSVHQEGELKDFAVKATGSLNHAEVVVEAAMNVKDDIKGSLKVQTPIEGFKTNQVSLNIHREGELNDFAVKATGSLNQAEIVVDAAMSVKDDIKGSLKVQTPVQGFKNNQASFSLHKEGELKDFAVRTTGSLNQAEVVVEAAMSVKDDIKGSLKVQTPVEGFKNNQVSINIHREGELNDFAVKVTGSLNQAEVVVDAAMKIKDEVTGSLMVKSPVEGYKNIGMSFKHAGSIDSFKSAAQATIPDGSNYSAKLNFYHYLLKTIQTTLEVKTPISGYEFNKVEYRHEGKENSFTCYHTMKYGNNKQMTYELNAARTAQPSVTVTLKTPFTNYEDLMATASLENNLPSASTVSAKLNAGNGNVMSLDGNLDLSRDISGSLSAKSSVKPFTNVGLSFNHAGNLDNFKCNGQVTFMDNKNIDGEIDFNSNRAKLMATLKTPFSGYKNMMVSTSLQNNLPEASTVSVKLNAGKGNVITIEGNLDLSSDMSGSLVLSTPVTGFSDIGMSFHHSGNLDNFNCDGKVTFMNNKDISGTINFKRTEAQLAATLKTPFQGFNNLALNFNHAGNLDNFNCAGSVTYMNNKDIVGTVSFQSKGSKLVATLKTPFESYEEMMASTSMINNLPEASTVSAKLNAGNGNVMSLNGNMDLSRDISGSLTATTPVRGFSNIGLSFQHSGNLDKFNSEGKVTYMNNKDITVTFKRSEGKLVAEVKTPFQSYEDMMASASVTNNLPAASAMVVNVNAGNGNVMSLTINMDLSRDISGAMAVTTPVTGFSNIGLNFDHSYNTGLSEGRVYLNNKAITVKVVVAASEISVELKTPFSNYKDMMASASLDNNLPAASSVVVKVNAGNGNVIAIEGNLETSNVFRGALKIATPVEDFNNVGINFQQSGDAQNFAANGKVTYMDDKTISGKIISKRYGSKMMAEVRTPFKGFKTTRVEFKESHNKRQSFAETTLTYANKQVIQTTYKLVSYPNNEIAFTMKTPFVGYEDMAYDFKLDTTGSDYAFDGKMSLGSNTVALKSGLDFSDAISGFVALKAPIAGYTKTGLEFRHSGNAQKFTCNGKVYADAQEIIGNVDFYTYMLRSLDVSAELKTPFTGMESTKAEMKYNVKSNTMSASSSLDYNNGQKIEGAMKMTNKPNYDIELTLNTPCEYLRNIHAVANADLSAPKFIVKTGLTYGDNKAYTAAGKLNLFSANNLDAAIEVKTPVTGSSTAEYEHKVDSSSISAKVAVAQDNKVVSAELQSTISPSFDATLTVKTPVVGFSSVSGSVAFEESHRKYEASSSLKLEGQNLYTMTSGLDMTLEPLRVFTKISTPHANFSNMELSLTHQGSLDNFQSTAFLSSPLTHNVNAEAAMNFQKLTEMNLKGSIKSALPGMDNLRLEVTTSDNSGENKVKAVAGWTDGQQISTEASLRTQKSWYETSMNADFSLATPFIALHSLSVQTEGTNKVEGKEAKVAIDVNGAKVLDVSGDYNTKDKNSASVVFKQPRAMQFTASGSNMDMDLFANWDRDTVDSNIRLIASRTDSSDTDNINRAFDMTVERSSGQMGVSHSQQMSASSMSSSGKLFWGNSDDQKVTYALGLDDSSRRNKAISDASFSLGLPSRTLALSGQVSNSLRAKTADATFKWNADRDDSQQVGVKATMVKGDNLQGDVTLSMPALKKEVKVSGQVQLDNGRIILDTKTDISYSTDTRKTLTLISKVKDMSSSSSSNYSVHMGLRHPFTNTDLQMTSNLGNSDNKMTLGMEASYLTMQRQTKTLALLGEINKLKKQITVQLLNPLNKIEIVGDVVSTKPTKLRLLNRIDDAEVFQSNMIIDSDRKCVELTAEMNNEKLAFNTEYPTIKDFSASVTHSNAEGSHQEALLAVHLNNSRLMHGRLAWKPLALTHLTQGLKQRATGAIARMGLNFLEVNRQVEEEVSGKYRTVSTHVRDEITPLVDALEQSIALFPGNTGLMTQLVHSLRSSISTMMTFDAGQTYLDMVTKSIVSLMEAQETLGQLSSSVDASLNHLVQASQGVVNSAHNAVYNSSYVNYAQGMINQAKSVDLSPSIRHFEMSEPWASAVSEVSYSGLESLLNSVSSSDVSIEGLKPLYSAAIQVWDVNQSLQQNLQHTLSLLIDLAQKELNELNALSSHVSPVTVNLPGEIQAELALPLEMHSLQQMPDASPLVARFERMVLTTMDYLPTRATLDSLAQSVSNLFPEKVEVKEAEEQLKKFKPTKKYKGKKGGKRLNKKVKQLKK